MDKAHLHILQHSLGLDEYGRGRGYRNHFVTGPGSDDYDACRALVERGLMVEHPPTEISGGGSCFTVTRQGERAVREESPAPPKLTRSQRRYLRFLDADSGLTFGEWLKIARE